MLRHPSRFQAPACRVAFPCVAALLCGEKAGAQRIQNASTPARIARPPAAAVARRTPPRRVVEMSGADQARVNHAVEQGLAWLAARQNPKGFWGGIIGTKTRDGYRAIRPIEEQQHSGTGHLGVTAICGMAFLSGGHLPGRGRYGANVQKAVDAVLSGLKEDGLLTMGGTRMYTHAFATLFLAEVYGMSRDAKIKSGLERATHMVVDCQNANGAWRYTPFTQDSDISVTVCQLQALRAARNIGIQIPKSVIDKAVAFVKGCRVTGGRYEGCYYYSNQGRNGRRKYDSYSIQAAAVTSLVSAGVYDRELIEPVMAFLTEELPEVMQYSPHHYYFWYGNYYASQAFFHADWGEGSGSFQRYYDRMREHLLADQESDGRWLNPPHEGPGDAFATAMACTILQIPNQYLPIFQR